MASSASSDEGEIRDGSAEKATTTPPRFDGAPVDRQDRNRSSKSLSMSPEPRYGPNDKDLAERARPAYSDRRPRGSKRPRRDDYLDRSRGDPRRFKVHYEDDPPSYQRRSQVSYDDIDRGSAANSELLYDDRDKYSQKRPRTRSRSPYRPSRRGDMDLYDSQSRRGGSRGYVDTERPTSYGYGNLRSRDIKDHATTNSEVVTEPEPEPETVPEPLDEDALIEQRRKRREAIKAKYRGSAPPLLVQALQLGDRQGQTGSPATSTPGTPQAPTSPAEFTITDDQDLANKNDVGDVEDDGPSAADYDPTMDMREDRRRDDKRHNDEVSSGAYDETEPTTEQDVLLPASSVPAEEAPKQSKDDFDMFAEDDDDMFAEEPAPNIRHENADEVAKAVPIPQAKELDIGMLDNWDDPEGYYKVILGELLNGRYHVQASLGKGMFSGVVRAMDVTSKKLVAIKLIRNNETMRKAGLKEIEILQKLNEADPEDKKHMIRLVRHFEHKQHLCMVFENLSINLREVLKKFGRDVGINLKAVRAYAQQMFLGLSLMRKCNILHADLKPDNILVNETRNMLKICDLGSASDASDNEITPYLVSRFYRAPEIILGMPYDFAIDIWSIGCTLYELYTGKILFTGRTNNQMLRSIMECRGKLTTKMLKRAQFAHIHFDEMANFRSIEQDKLTGKDVIKTLSFTKPSRDLRTRLISASKGLTEAETKELALFTDLLDRCLALNPEKRCTPHDALKHPFITRATR
ncbi:hypothetical protein OIDMADRAFT_121348 [Oidiodendron maius Zn]|uniref:non-specific serine/threonine protein kinase n=1 Tax=Oidiodendron maius (strain Zn) TaxID=913774 RepID=A0A0C3HHE8_OIDMZ|nr:hypothetical protein OIDMADRAFT_121348 [Oidiodendron maius Zn]